MKSWKAYILGYRQEWADNHRELCKQLIAESDFCIESPGGVPVGMRFNTTVIYEGKDGFDIPSKLKCVSHEHNGKVIHCIQDFDVS